MIDRQPGVLSACSLLRLRMRWLHDGVDAASIPVAAFSSSYDEVDSSPAACELDGTRDMSYLCSASRRPFCRILWRS